MQTKKRRWHNHNLRFFHQRKHTKLNSLEKQLWIRERLKCNYLRGYLEALFPFLIIFLPAVKYSPVPLMCGSRVPSNRTN